MEHSHRKDIAIVALSALLVLSLAINMARDTKAEPSWGTLSQLLRKSVGITYSYNLDSRNPTLAQFSRSQVVLEEVNSEYAVFEIGGRNKTSLKISVPISSVSWLMTNEDRIVDLKFNNGEIMTK